MQRSGLPFPSVDPAPDEKPESACDDLPDMAPIKGRVKWFDTTRGFGFLVCDDVDGDVLLHFSVLREHGRRSVPEGALIECVPVKRDRGLQAQRVLSIDLSTSLHSSPTWPASPRRRQEREALQEVAGEFQLVEVKWFNQISGYGFVNRSDNDEDIFVHMETVRQSGLRELQAGQTLEARIAQGPRGLTAIELRTS